jgi:farnesol dehydrogenase
MKILVTGATGFLGRAVVSAMAARGHAVVAFARTASASPLSCARVDGDIRDEGAVLAAADGCDAICHLAALVSVWRRRRAEFDEVNIGGLRTVLQVAARLGIGRIVYTSSFLALPPGGSAEPVTLNDYQRTKVLADRVAAGAVERGAPLIRIYPGVVYGPGPLGESNLVGHMIADHLAGRLPGLVGASRRWSYAFLDDGPRDMSRSRARARGERYVLGGQRAPDARVRDPARSDWRACRAGFRLSPRWRSRR